MAGIAIFWASTYHWSISHGSITSFDLSPWGTVWVIVSSFTNKFNDFKVSKIFFLAWNLSKPSKSFVPFSFIDASALKILIISKLWRLPTSKSLKSWAGVIFTAPEPFSGSEYLSKIIGIGLFKIGRITFLPFKWLYLSSSGLTATAVSPSMVSGLVVAIVIYSLLSSMG